MKFRCERDILIDILNSAGRAVSTRGGSLPVLSGVRLEVAGDDLTVTGSDLDLTIIARATVAGETDGVTVLPSRLASDIVKVLEPGKVEVEITGDEATITSGRSQFAVRAIPATEFPRIAEPEGEEVTLDAAALADALRQVVPAASTDESRSAILTGVLMTAEEDGLRLVATDSYRLAIRDLVSTSFLSEGQGVLIPGAALREVSRLLADHETVTLRCGERDAAFLIGSSTLITRLIAGDFPNYRNLIPKSQPTCLTVGRETLLDAVKRVKVVARDPSNPVKLDMGPDGLKLTASAQDVGTAVEELDAKYEGGELTVAFNPDYLVAGLEAAEGDEVTLECIDALKPALLRTLGNQDFLYLLMPVRVS